HEFHFVEYTDNAAADGTQPSGGLRALVRKRRDSRTTRRPHEAKPEHSGFAHGRTAEPEKESRRFGPANHRSIYGRGTRDRAADSTGGKSVHRGSVTRRTVGGSRIICRTSQDAFGFDGDDII